MLKDGLQQLGDDMIKAILLILKCTPSRDYLQPKTKLSLVKATCVFAHRATLGTASVIRDSNQPRLSTSEEIATI